MTGPLDRPDWIQGFQSYLSGKVLYSATGTALPISETGIDLRGVGTIYVTPDISVSNPTNDLGLFGLEWLFGSTELLDLGRAFWDSSLYQSVGALPTFGFPVQGETMNFSMGSNSGTGTGDITIMGVSQIIPAQTTQVRSGSVVGTLLTVPSVDVAAGATTSYYVPSAQDGYWLHWGTTAPGLRLDMFACATDTAASDISRVYSETFTAGGSVNSIVVAPNVPCRVDLVNANTSTATAHVSIVALP